MASVHGMEGQSHSISHVARVMSLPPSLPSVLPSQPALQDVDATAKEIKDVERLGKVTTPEETPIFVCGIQECFKLFPSRERLSVHRQREHKDEEEEGEIITWNE